MGKVGILTFHWADDYGAMLQAYGLLQTVRRLGYDAEIVPYATKEMTSRYDLYAHYHKRNEAGGFDHIIPTWLIRRNLRHFPKWFVKKKRMVSFRKRYLTSRINRLTAVQLKLCKYHRFLVGSDQVWNPDITVGIDPIYTGNFERDSEAKVIAYAPSIGRDELPPHEEGIFWDSIGKNFDALSVREESARAYLCENLDRDVVVMPDPTLLLNCRQWSELSRVLPQNRKSMSRGYVLVYWTEINKEMSEYADSLAKAYGMEVIDARDLPLGPREFLGYVRNADYVVTNSFHGTVFAILFKRKFVVFSHSNRNGRLTNLLEILNLSDRIGTQHELADIDRVINWSEVDLLLEQQRTRAYRYIAENLDAV